MMPAESGQTRFVEQCKDVLCSFEGYNEFMYTCVVEYSLICAGVAFVCWTNIDLSTPDCALRRTRRRSLLTIDCSRTAEGLFAGNEYTISK
ncbi:hypothetical protein KIN20_015053 [Parelaphostrongylus tenuis]|uniref:Uncharacterized protein n=1 Tax=Parelaphostrongylus tenuis TaxID=148309 RepID=A0AAD5N074_PARTN|nr:hypothetical protein KIN20_015053 [Parelaphostrongylus tenuis]